MFSGKHILIAPLDWGMGHATRSTELIFRLKENNQITVGYTAKTKPYFDSVFPDLKKVELPGYNIRYSNYLPVWLKILLQTQNIQKTIALENLVIKALQAEHKFDVIISDSRFGLRHPSTQNIVVAHQLSIKSPVFPNFASKINQNYLAAFDTIWVPDFENFEESLAGDLSHNENLKSKLQYIGPLSHLKFAQAQNVPEKIKCLAILSGPEPQRSIFEKEICAALEVLKLRSTLVRGSFEKSRRDFEFVKVIDQASAQEIKTLINSAEIIICRSGYSTLMDLYAMQAKNVILVPTPGQTEQEYLAEFWQKKFGAKRLLQHQIKSKLLSLLKTHLHPAQ